MLTFRSLHNIDLTSNLIMPKEIPTDFATFIADYLRFASSNESTKKYTTIDNNTQVISCISQLFQHCLTNETLTEEIQYEMDALALSIAQRLLRAEIDAQNRIAHMKKYIKKGSLVQALIKNEGCEGDYLFIVAKVEHSEWFDGESLQKSFGFPSEKKNVWKSAVIPIYFTENELHFGSIRIYIDNEARYWTKEFLELIEEESDETNTKTAFEEIDRILRISLKKKYPRDYYILRNAVIKTMKTPQLLNYNEYIEALVGQYVPDDNNVNTTQLKTKLLQLPSKKKFDTQFTTVPHAVSAHKKLKFEPSEGIVINVDSSIENYKDIITACVDENHRMILKVRCTDLDTFKAFGGR